MDAEHLTGWVSATASTGEKADIASSFFKNESFKQSGSPSVVLIDQSQPFLSDARENALKLKGMDARDTAAYSPQPNARAERNVQTIKLSIT